MIEHAPHPTRPRTCSCGTKFSTKSKLRKHLAKYERGGEPTAFQATPVARSSHQGRRRGSFQ